MECVPHFGLILFQGIMSMRKNRKLHIGMSLAPTWLSGDAWRRSDSNVEGILGLDYYADIARRAEAAHLDFVFRPDALFLPVDMLENGPGFTSLDPTVLLAALVRETTHIGLLSTVSTTFLPPYMVARQIQSLNWLCKGRAGWNIVTALDGHENFGLDVMPSAEERYERAAEFTEVVRLLWNSYPANAVMADRTNGIYAEPGQIRAINHSGPHFRISGPMTLPPFGDIPIPLVQAGASPAGRNFAASIANAVFASTPDKEAAIELRRDLQSRARSHGRRPEDIRLLPGLSLYLAETTATARELFAETHARTENARGLAAIKSMTGLDLADWPHNRRVRLTDFPAVHEKPRSQTHADLLYRLIEREEPSVTDLLRRPEVIGSGHWQIVGTVDDAFRAISDWRDAGAIDGFIAVPGGSVSSMHLTLDLLIPQLAEKKLFRSAYTSDTFYGHLCEN